MGDSDALDEALKRHDRGEGPLPKVYFPKPCMHVFSSISPRCLACGADRWTIPPASVIMTMHMTNDPARVPPGAKRSDDGWMWWTTLPMSPAPTPPVFSDVVDRNPYVWREDPAAARGGEWEKYGTPRDGCPAPTPPATAGDTYLAKLRREASDWRLRCGEAERKLAASRAECAGLRNILGAVADQRDSWRAQAREYAEKIARG